MCQAAACLRYVVVGVDVQHTSTQHGMDTSETKSTLASGCSRVCTPRCLCILLLKILNPKPQNAFHVLCSKF
jgi:hypothetical protein